MSFLARFRYASVPGLAITALLGLLFFSQPARAHFLWLTAELENGRPAVHAFLNEPPDPGGPEFMKLIEKATYSAQDQPLSPQPAEETYLLPLPEPAPHEIDGQCDLGLMTKADATFRLFYTARTQLGPRAADATERLDGLRVALLAQPDGPARVRVWFNHQPVARALVKLYDEDGSTRDTRTDANGWLDPLPEVADGRTAVLAKWFDHTPGTAEGKPFAETRHYATLTLMIPSTDPALTADAPPSPPSPYAELPEPTNSLGAAVVDSFLYVYSGHVGTTHRYDRASQNPHFRRLNLRERTTWEELPVGPPLQGLPLVAYMGALYRTGGMKSLNDQGEPENLVSVAEVARFDPLTATWSPLPPMPETRSTHDAVVLNDHLYVVGGWSLPGGPASEAQWCDGMLRLNLSAPENGWERIEAPFERRALAAATHAGKIYAIAGLTDTGEVVRQVDIYDPATGTWSAGPELPGSSRTQGFAPSAFEVAGRLYASGADGRVYRLRADGQAWESLGSLVISRIAHRLLPGVESDLLLVGGSHGRDLQRSIESFPIPAEPAPPVQTMRRDAR